MLTYVVTAAVICILVSVIGLLVYGKIRSTEPDVRRNLLDEILERQCAASRCAHSSHNSTSSSTSAGGDSQLAALEGHPRMAILDPSARERLISEAMRATGKGRRDAIRKVLYDLENEDRRLA
jgi:hypothetical protein